MVSFDYIVVGAGSAGCVLAQSSASNRRGLLLEAGPVDHPWAWQLHLPGGARLPAQERRYNWGSGAKPEPTWTAGASLPARPGARRLVIDQRYGLRARPRPRLRPLGESGCAAGTMPASCPTSSAPRPAPRVATTTVATEGRCTSALARRNPLYGAFIEAGRQAGFPTADMNGYQQEGFGPMDMTVGRAGAGARRARTSIRREAAEPHRAHPRVARRVRFEGARGRRRLPRGRRRSSSRAPSAR